MKQVLKRLSLLALSLALVMAAALPCWAADTAAAPTDAPAETEEMAEMPGDGATPEGESMPEMGPPQIQLAEGDEVDLGFNVEKATMIIAIVFTVAAVAVLGLFIFRAVRIRSVRKVGSALLCVVLAALLVLNIAVARFNVVVNQFLSGQGSSDEITAAEEASKAKTQELEGRGNRSAEERGQRPASGGEEGQRLWLRLLRPGLRRRGLRLRRRDQERLRKGRPGSCRLHRERRAARLLLQSENR